MPRLDIRIVGARNLYNVQSFGTIDPFCTVEFEHKRFQTNTQDNTVNPEWNEVFKFNVADAESSQLMFSVWNDNPFSDDFLGCYPMSISGLNRGEVEEKVVLLQQCKGNAELIVRIMAVDFGDVDEGEPETTYAPPRTKPQGGLPPALAVQYQAQYQQQVQFYQQAPPTQFQAPPPPPERPAYVHQMGAAPPGFNAEEYLSFYPDLQAAVDQNDRAGWALRHWQEYGQKEGRGYSRSAQPFDFDHEEYLNRYIDLLKAVSGQYDRRRWAIEHWLHYGQNEGRYYKAWTLERSEEPPNWNAEEYLSFYPDLQAAVDQNDRAGWALRHYRDYGYNEGRGFSRTALPPGFNAEQYLGKYPDLAAAVQGDRQVWAAEHFVNQGAPIDHRTFK